MATPSKTILTLAFCCGIAAVVACGAPALAATRAEAAQIAALQAQVQGLMDREAVRQVILDYARTIDARDWTTHRTLFTDEVEVEGGQKRPLDDLIAGKRAFFGSLPATQHIANALLVEIKGDEAHVTAQLHAQHFLPNEVGDPVQRMIGTYDYWMVRSPTGWKIRKYLHKTAWNEGNFWIYDHASAAAQAASTPVANAAKPVR